MANTGSTLKVHKLSEEELSRGLSFFETLGIIKPAEGNKYILTETGEQFFAILGCGKAKFSELCFELFDSLVKSGKVRCRYNLKDKSYYFKLK
jgi:hypothetical protein